MTAWAQLRAGPSVKTGLERGRWYPVESHEKDGTIRVVAPDGTALSLQESLFRVSAAEPDFITRVEATPVHVIRSGSRMPDLFYYGVCPRQHHIKRVGPADGEAQCAQCGQSYRVEDEQRG